jgi:hypothetical protein
MSKDGRVSWKQKKLKLKNVPALSAIRRMGLFEAQRLPLEEKKIWFESKCTERRISFLQDSITLVINREHILRDSLEQFRTTDDFDLHKEIKIFYVDEVAQDAGGLIREWVTELTRALFTQDTGLFKQTKSSEELTYFPCSKARVLHPGEFRDYFRFAGQVLAKALFDKIPVFVHLNKLILKRLVANPRQGRNSFNE